MVYQFEMGIYPRMLWVALETTKEELESKFNIEVPESALNGGANTTNLISKLNTQERGILIFTNEKSFSINHLCHESYHAALELAKSIGMNLSFEDQEPMAYLIGFIGECIEKAEIAFDTRIEKQ